ncbi:MAG: hypothetical protein ACREBC_33925, partial [Pyrinomonadaceae bacterium]
IQNRSSSLDAKVYRKLRHSYFSGVAQALRYSRSMEATQSYPNLLSEKQAAKRFRHRSNHPSSCP